MLFTALLVSRPNCSGCGWTSSLPLLLDHPLVVGRESVVCRGRVLVLCSSAFLGTARRVVGGGNIWTDCYRWAGAGYCWLLLVAGLLITALCRRLTLSLVWRLVTALTQGRQSTVCSAYDLDYNNARLLAYLYS